MADLAGSMKARISGPSLNPWSSSPFAARQSSAHPSTTAAEASAGEVHESDVVPDASAHKLGWVEGVLIPCLLNIWGVIMFMRLGWVAGQAGIWYGLLVIVAANAVTLVTALSMCAIATNGEVKAGGAYFMISRALGPTYGGSIGIIFYAANAVASALFVTGFSEALIDIIRKQGAIPFTGSWSWDTVVIGLGTCAFLVAYSLCCGVGGYAQMQKGLMMIIFVALISTMVGFFYPEFTNKTENQKAGFIGFGNTLPPEFSGEGSYVNQTVEVEINGTMVNATELAPFMIRASEKISSNFWPQWSRDPASGKLYDFFSVFAVFFPAVTGVMAGANMSGDLKDPSTAIPRGTLLAIFITFLSYVMLLVSLCLSCVRCVGVHCPEDPTAPWGSGAFDAGLVPGGGLIYDKIIMEGISLYAPLVYVGIFAATLSSALGCLVGAPRILQSVAKDKIFPLAAIDFFAEGSGPEETPVRATAFTFGISVAFIFIGHLDLIAPIISNLFILSYAFVNYACFAQSNTNSPGWRPSFQYYSKWLSLLGAVMCIILMFSLNWFVALMSVGASLLVFFFLEAVDPDVNWGPVGNARLVQRAISLMERIQLTVKNHVKTFRPNYLIMHRGLSDSPALVNFIAMLGAGRGISLFVNMLKPGLSFAPGMETKNDAVRSEARASAATSPRMIASDIMRVDAARESDIQYFYDRRFLTLMRGAFCDATVSETLYSGLAQALQLSGMGMVRPNIVVAAFMSDWGRATVDEVKDYESTISLISDVERGAVILRDNGGFFAKSSSWRLQSAPWMIMPTRAVSKIRHSTAGAILGECFGFLTFCCMRAADTFDSLALANTYMPANDSEGLVTKKEFDVRGVELTSMDSPAKSGADKEYTAAAAASPESSSGPLSNTTGVQRQLNSRKKVIDIWWLLNDGGLSLLLPYLLQSPDSVSFFAAHKLRVMVLSTNEGKEQEEDSIPAMVQLLQKYRIQAETHLIYASELSTQPGEEWRKKYEESGFTMDDDKGSRRKGDATWKEVNSIAATSETTNNDGTSKSTSIVRLAELIDEQSREASCIFITMPTREAGLAPGRYMSWLDILSQQEGPVVLVRGVAEKPVLTYYA